MGSFDASLGSSMRVQPGVLRVQRFGASGCGLGVQGFRFWG